MNIKKEISPLWIIPVFALTFLVLVAMGVESVRHDYREIDKRLNLEQIENDTKGITFGGGS